MFTELPIQIRQALEPLVATLAAARLVPVEWEQSQSFGDFHVKFVNQSLEFTLNRDRSQFMISDPEREQIETVGLWRAFDTLEEMQPALSKWLGLRGGA